MDALTALRLQIEWGADEALADAPLDRLRPPEAIRPAGATIASGPPSTGRGLPPAARATLAAAQADTPEALQAALAGFDGCALRDTASRLVFDAGNPASRLMLIGDTPGEAEDRAGRPFAGPAGAYLDRMLGSIGLGREQVLIGMVVPWRPPGGRPPTEAEIACCLPFLMRHIAIAQPRRLVLLGSVVTRAVLPMPSGSRRLPRGEWLGISVSGLPTPIPALPTASPATLLGKPADRRRAWAELRMVKRALDQELANS